jgi:pyruvate kinase
MTSPTKPPNPPMVEIVATLGPASSSVGAVSALRAAGADRLRLNASFLSATSLGGHLDAVQEAGLELSLVVVDLQGGKVRLAELPAPVDAVVGRAVRLVPAGEAQPSGEAPCLPVDRPEFVRALRPGDVVRVDDGRITLAIETAEGPGWRAELRGEGLIRSRKGLALVGRHVGTGAEPLERDLELLLLARGRGVEDFAVSYATSAELLRAFRAAADSVRAAAVQAPARIHAKIEHPAAAEALGELMSAADSLWLCRGDLGAEVGLEDLPWAHKRVLDEALGRVPLLVAGQVLHHMTVSPRPTRSEACHVADLVWRGVGGFVLSDETASGPHGAEAVRWLRRLVRRASDETA